MIRILILALAALPAAPSPQDATALLDRAYAAAYNLDYDIATGFARQGVAAAPNDPRTHRALASVLWLDIIFRRGTVTTDTYLSGMMHTPTAFPAPPADLDGECRAETAKAIDLAEAWVKREPDSIEAKLELGSVYALRASYIASVTGNSSSAFGPARRAYDTDEDVLSKDPSKMAATVVVGLYRYIVSTLALPSRWFAYIAGFGGGKEKGIGLLEAAAASHGEGHVEAAVSLLLIDAREGRHGDAVALATRLEQEYPRNRLFTIEAASAAIRAGHGAEADAILTRGMAALATDPRPRFPGESALWPMKRGMARTEEGRLNDATTDLRTALSSAPTPWIAGRSHLELGKIADLEGRRSDARAEYRLSRDLCTAAHDDPCVNDANRLSDKPFRGK